MSVPPSQSTDFFRNMMQKHDRDAYNIYTSTGEVAKSDEDSGSRPPSPQGKPMDSGTEPPPASSKSNKPEKVSGTGPPPPHLKTQIYLLFGNNYSGGVIPSGPGAKRRSGGGTKGTPQTKYVPERHERDGSKFCKFCNVTEGNNPIGHTVFECKDPRCTRSKVPKELRSKIGEADQPARSGSVVRGRGGRGRRVSRFRGSLYQKFGRGILAEVATLEDIKVEVSIDLFITLIHKRKHHQHHPLLRACQLVRV
ncbi:hypothetical protein P9112_010538 [Eukaryota sp. TZLM1-RC]